MRHGLFAGAVTAAVIVGAVVGFGVRLGGPAAALREVGWRTFGAALPAAASTLLVVLMFAFAGLALGLAVAALVARFGGGTWPWAVALGAGFFVLLLVAGRGPSAPLAGIAPANRLVLALLVTVALAVGMRLALDGRQRG